MCLANSLIQLSQEELQYIKNNPEVTLASGESFEPFIFKDNNGKVSGIDREVANLIEQKTGLKIHFEFGPWNEIQQQAHVGEFDGLATVAITKERQSLYNFTRPYLNYTAIALVNRANHNKIYTREDVKNKKAAVQIGNEGFDKLTRSLAGVEVVYYDDIYAVLHAVVNNEVDFAILDESVFYVAHEAGIRDFISTSFVLSTEEKLYFALTNKKPLLASIFNKALDDISPHQLLEIKTRWFEPRHRDTVIFSPEENDYLSHKKVINYCTNPDFYPIESIENNTHQGAGADFIKLFAEQIATPFNLIKTNSWLESMAAIENGHCDLLPLAMKTPARSKKLNFTSPYLSIPLVVATKIEAPFSQRLSDLNHRKIAIVEGYAYSEIIQHNYPRVNLVEVANIREGLAKVESGELFGFIGALASISHQFQQGYSATLKITGRFDEEWELSVATRKGDVDLHSIFEKVLTTVDEEKRSNALNKYIAIHYEGFVNYAIIFNVMLVSVIIFFILFFLNKKLKNEKADLAEQYEELRLIKDNIAGSQKRLEILLKRGEIGDWEFNVDDFKARCSLIHDQIFGYHKELPEWTYELFLAHVIPQDRHWVDNKFKSAIENNKAVEYECRIVRKDGEIRWILGTGGPGFDSTGRLTLMSGVVQDINERKTLEIRSNRHNAELHSLINALPDIYFRMSPNGVILDYHAPDAGDLYLAPEFFIGKTMQSVLPEDVGNLFEAKLDEISKVNETVIFNYSLPIKEAIHYFDARLNRISVSNQVICVVRDVTEEFKSKEYLAASEQLFRLFFEHAAIGVALLNAETSEFIRVNQRLCDMLGYTIKEMTNGKTYKDITHPDDIQISANYLGKILEGEQREVTLEKRYIHKDGHAVWIELTISPSHDTEETEPVIVVIQDISERKKAEDKLRLAANVFTYAAEGIVITDGQGTIIDVNDTFTKTTGYSRNEVIGQNPRLLKSGRQSTEFYTDMWKNLLEKGYWSGEVWNRRKNNEVYAEMLNISAVKNASGDINNFVGLFTDITQMKEHQGQLEHSAHYDLLTNLPNRSLLADRLSQAMLQCNRHKKSLAVVFLDLDGFKAVNDNYGHDVGDELLILLSVRMKHALREGDTFSRLGGDEFVAVLADLDKIEDCEPVLERLLLAASEPIKIKNNVLNVSASVGVTLYPQDNDDADILLRHADQAMYVAKASGKNRYHFFNTEQDDAAKAERQNLEDIRSALDNHQFVLYYQPKVNMRKGYVTGVEALIRWQHPKKGLLSPAEFLPFVENQPMSIEIGEWVINTALAQISEWQKLGLKLPVSTSVNIAANQLQQIDFMDKLSHSLAKFPDVAPESLELEVLETSGLEDIHHISEVMNDCSQLGVKFALDDFGTGYSSLTYLRRLPASMIKIDQSFVRDMLDDPDDLAIVEGVIALARSFKREVIAEGVETIEHGTALLEIGCELAQGYGIAKPMPAEELPTWVEQWQPDNSWQGK